MDYDEGLEKLVELIVADSVYDPNHTTWEWMLEAFEGIGISRAEVMEAQLRRRTVRFENERSVLEHQVETASRSDVKTGMPRLDETR